MRPVTREVKRFNAQGGMINYGALAVGVHLGIECLGKREGLIALGMRLVNKKPPVYFETSVTLSVKVNPHLSVTVYVVDGGQLDRLGFEISSCGYCVHAVPRFDDRPFLKSWENGKVVYSAPEKSVSKIPSVRKPGVKGFVSKVLKLLRRA